MAAGDRNGTDLYHVRKGKVFAGWYDVLRQYLNRLIDSRGRPGKRDADTKLVEGTPPSARKLSFRVANPKADGARRKFSRRCGSGTRPCTRRWKRRRY